MTEHGRVGKLTEPQKVILKQMEKNMKDIKKIRKMLQQKDKIQKRERYHTVIHIWNYLHILYYRNQIVFRNNNIIGGFDDFLEIANILIQQIWTWIF